MAVNVLENRRRMIAAQPHKETDSGGVVSFRADKALPLIRCVAQIEPVQDLNGYDSPWPAGGGANLLDLDKAAFSSGAYGLSITRAEDVITVSGTVSNTTLTYLSFAIITNYSTAELSGKGYICQTFTVGTPTHSIGAVWGFRTESERAFAISLVNAPAGSVVNVSFKMSVAATSQSAWTPYSNICPISGWTGANVARAGKNLIEVTGTGRTNNGVTYTVNQDGTISLTGTASGGTSWWRGPAIITDWRYIKAGTYRLSGGISNNIQLYIIGQYIDGTALMNLSVGGGVYDKGSGLTFTLYQDAYINYQIQVNNGTSTGVTVYPIISDSATAYTPYSGSTYPITFPSEAGTVYGGTLDVVNGMLTVDRAVKMYNGASSEGWTKSDYGYFVTRKITDAIDRNANPEDFQNNKYAYGTIANNTTTLGGCLIWASVRVRVSDMSISLDDWKSQLSAEPLQVVYRLATPITYTLIPHEIKALIGANNVWADTGDVTVARWAH